MRRIDIFGVPGSGKTTIYKALRKKRKQQIGIPQMKLYGIFTEGTLGKIRMILRITFTGSLRCSSL